MSTGGPSANTPARIHLDRSATWQDTDEHFLAAKQDPVGEEVDTANLYRLFGRRQADWYDDQLKALGGVVTGERDTPGLAVRSVLDPEYGAVYDATTDCTEAFNACLAAVAADGGGIVLVPPVEDTSTERYRLAGEVSIPAGVTLVGCGARSLLMCRRGAGAQFSFADGFCRSGMRDLVLLGNSATPVGVGVSLVESQFVELVRLQLWDFEVGIDVSDGTPFSAYNKIDHCEINRSTVCGIRIHQSSNGVVIIGGRVFYTFDGGNGGIAIDVQDSRAVCIVGVSLEAYDIGLRLAGAACGSMVGSWMEKGANGAPGTDRHDFEIDSFEESPFFEGDFHFAGNHSTDRWLTPASFTRLAVDRLTDLGSGNLTIGAGFGASPDNDFAAGSNEHRGEITITAAGGSYSADPTVVVTFPDGVADRPGHTIAMLNGGTDEDVRAVRVTDQAGSFTLHFTGTPTNGNTTIVRYVRML